MTQRFDRLTHAERRAETLRRLKAFGLFVEGSRTYYQIAQAIDIVGDRPDTAAGRARARVIGGWLLVRHLRRWRELADWNTVGAPMHGARLDKSPPPAVAPPQLTPFEQLRDRLTEAEAFAAQHGFTEASIGLRNMRAALAYWERQKTHEVQAQAK